MLDVDPGQRLTLGQVLQHRWIVSRESLPSYQLRLQPAGQIKVGQGQLTCETHLDVRLLNYGKVNSGHADKY
jgi:hypothetical protein